MSVIKIINTLMISNASNTVNLFFFFKPNDNRIKNKDKIVNFNISDITVYLNIFVRVNE